MYDICVVYDIEGVHTVEALDGFINMEGGIYMNYIEGSCMSFRESLA